MKSPVCSAGVPEQVILPVASELHDTTNNLSRELQQQLRRSAYDFQRADRVLHQLGAHNSRSDEPKKASAKSNKASAAPHGVQQQSAQPNGTANGLAQPRTDAQPASTPGISNSATKPGSVGSQRDAQNQQANGFQQEANGLKQEANGLKQQAEDTLHPAVASAANPEPIARTQKRAASAQPAESGTAAPSQTDEPAAKKLRVFSDGAAPLTGAALWL